MTTTDPRPDVALMGADPTPLDAHVAEYLDDQAIVSPKLAASTREAIEHGWHGALADVAERIREIHDEAEHRVKVLHLHYDILGKLDELAAELEEGLGA